MTELELRASEAWVQVVRTRTIFDTIGGTFPMLPAIALDYVQDVCGDRDDAVTALLDAAARWLEAKMPKADMVGIADEANAVASYLRGESLDLADSSTHTVSFRARDTFDSLRVGAWRDSPDAPSSYLCELWRRWSVTSHTAIQFARAICKAAYPETSESA